MTVSVKRRDLRGFVRTILFEQMGSRAVAPGDKTTMPPPTGNVFGITVGNEDTYDTGETTLGQDIPIEPSEMMASQLADERPPVEDESYVPANVSELSRAAKVLAQLIPDLQVQSFYEDFKNLVQDHLDQPQSDDIERPLGMQEKLPVEQEEDDEAGAYGTRVESVQCRHLVEADSDDDWWEKLEGPSSEDVSAMEAGEERGEFVAAIDVEPVEDKLGAKDKFTFEDLMSLTGHKYASGARQWGQKTLQKLGYILESVDPEGYRDLMEFAAAEYAAALKDGGFIDEDEAEELKAGQLERIAYYTDPAVELSSYGSSGFRAFLNYGFLAPGFRAVKRKGTQPTERFLDQLGVPRRSKQTIMNQVTGAAKPNRGVMVKKLIRDAMAEGQSEEEAIDLAGSVQRFFPKIARMATPVGDLVQIAKDRWSSLSSSRKQETLRSALEEIAGFEEDLAAME